MGLSLINIHLLCLFLFLSLVKNVHSAKLFDINTFGAVSGGKTDSSQAILKAWTEACRTSSGGGVLIPDGTYLVKPINLVGTNCKGPMQFIVRGLVLAPNYGPNWGDPSRWIAFQYVDNLLITGGGIFDGQGASAWPYNGCQKNPKCNPLPVSLRLDFVKHARMNHITLLNSKYFHVTVFACSDVILDNVHITAPGDSPNTDGIHVADTDGFSISDSIISTGDDCLSFGPGSTNVDVTRVKCGPGHGISIGSLGGYPGERDVANFSVTGCTFVGTQNGVRIKTWASQFPGNVYNLTFDHNAMDNVSNPIIVDQNYCPSNHCSHQGSSQVKIHDVKFSRIYGTSSSKVAVTLKCSGSHPCKQIELNNIRLHHQGTDGPEISQCSSAQGVALGIQQPSPCLQNNI